MGDGWIRPAQVKLVAEAVLKACDKADGAEDLVVEDAVGCKAAFTPETLRCAEGQSGDQCLTDAQINAINTLHSPYKFSFAMANGLDDYPGWGVSGEDTPSFGPTGGWLSWWLGKAKNSDSAPTCRRHSWMSRCCLTLSRSLYQSLSSMAWRVKSARTAGWWASFPSHWPCAMM